MLEIKNTKKLDITEMTSINGGSAESYLLGFVIGAYVDFEIGMAIGIGNSIAKAWNSL